jgi:MFS family permease
MSYCIGMDESSQPPPDRESSQGPFGLPRPVWYLGLASLFNDTASEAAYPLLPVFLTQVLGASAVSLGIVEGVAEAANSLLKVLSGYVSDRWRRRRPIVIGGYSLAAAVKPLIAVVASWPQVLVIRFLDRVGKGIRGAPRDAMLADCATPETRGKIFGFHRAMDHVGAVVGPLLATAFLLAYPGRYRTLFTLTIVPGLIAVGLLFKVREPASEARGGSAPARSPIGGKLGDSVANWRSLPRGYYRFLWVLLLFTLGNSTDAFLLLRLNEVGIGVAFIPLLWALLHVGKAGVSLVGGAQSDRLGRRVVIGGGWAIYALVYGGFALARSTWALVTWFLIYSVYYGLSEGTEKALIADLAPPDVRGTAFGIYNAVLGIGSLAASVLFGVIWKLAGAPVAFAVGAALALSATLLLFLTISEPAPLAATAPPRR